MVRRPPGTMEERLNKNILLRNVTVLGLSLSALFNPSTVAVQAARTSLGPATDLYVAPGGDDHNVGTLTAPLRTLARAQARVRALWPAASGPMNVWVSNNYRYNLDRFEKQSAGVNISMKVLSTSYAYAQGFRVNDVIRRVDGTAITTKASFWAVYHTGVPGSTVKTVLSVGTKPARPLF